MGKLRHRGLITCPDLSRQVAEARRGRRPSDPSPHSLPPVLNSRTSGSRAVGTWGVICQLALVPTSFPCPLATPPSPQCPSRLSHTRSFSPSRQRKGRSLAESGGVRPGPLTVALRIPTPQPCSHTGWGSLAGEGV